MIRGVTHSAPVRQLTFAEYDDPPYRSQSPEFEAVRAGMERRYPAETALLLRVTLRLAAESGAAGFTSEDVLDAAGGRNLFPRNLIGAVLGTLRAHHSICVMGREKARHPAAKGRWVNRFKLNAEALEVPRDP